MVQRFVDYQVKLMHPPWVSFKYKSTVANHILQMSMGLYALSSIIIAFKIFCVCLNCKVRVIVILLK